MMLVCKTHLGTRNCDYRMKRYVFRRTVDGIHIIHLGKTWEKLMVAARVIVAIENPSDIIVASQRPYGSRAVLKFSQYTGAHARGPLDARHINESDHTKVLGAPIINGHRSTDRRP